MVKMVKSATQAGRSYAVEMHGLKAISCVCASRRYRPGVTCQHMLDAEKVERAEAIAYISAELDTLAAEVGDTSWVEDLAACGYFEAMLPVRAAVVPAAA